VTRRGEPPADERAARALAVWAAHERRAQGPVPPHVEIRTASFRIPGVLGFLLAIPAFLLFGVLAIAIVVLGAVGTMLAPWVLRRMVRQMEAEIPPADATIELDRSEYRDEDRAQERAEISRSSSSRSRGRTSE
jgi:hypothetical protein